jgi:hypothetical protein
MPSFPPRIHVVLARKAPVGLVIRRGPSKSVATILWDRQRDDFQLGQWLRGRIFERRSDLSPDGKHFIYFAMNGKWKSETGGSWTAISRVPYLNAVALFAKGDCWQGGGLWTSNKTYWLNGCHGHTLLQEPRELSRDLTYTPVGGGNSECLGVYYPRLLRDGWSEREREVVSKWKHIQTFEKPVGRGWVLRKIAHEEVGAPPGKGCYWDEHVLLHPKSKATIACPNWEWADMDLKRLVWAADGKLKSAKITDDGPNEERELYDFAEMAFTPIKAPY